jgi:hypothetical protein
MAAWFRRVFAPLTLAVFLCTLALPLVPGVHVQWDDDEDGGPVGLERYAAVFQNSPATPPAGHCALCHWLHALASVTVGEPVSATPGFFLRELLRPAFAQSPAQPARSQGSSRAPPSVLTA